MSVKMMGIVWDSDLPRPEKLVLLAYADKAEHDGSSIFPSHGRVAWMTGYGKRQVIRITNQLLAAGILEEVGWSQHETILYQMHAEVLRPLPPYKRGVKKTPRDKVSKGGGDILSKNGVKMSPNPSVRDPSVRDPSKKKTGRKRLTVSDVSFPKELSSAAFRAVFAEWLVARAEIKKPATASIARRQLKILTPFGEARATELVERSIAGGYQGIVFDSDKPAAAQHATVARAVPQNPGGGAI